MKNKSDNEGDLACEPLLPESEGSKMEESIQTKVLGGFVGCVWELFVGIVFALCCSVRQVERQRETEQTDRKHWLLDREVGR